MFWSNIQFCKENESLQLLNHVEFCLVSTVNNCYDDDGGGGGDDDDDDDKNNDNS